MRRGQPAGRTPALILKIGTYPVHAGGVGAIRSLGRLGVPVYAATEDRLTPAALSRYCAGRLKWRTTGREDPGRLIRALNEAGDRIGRRTVLIPVDDESATLAAEHAADLAGRFLLPAVRPGLPRQLASKYRLSELCRRHGVPAPRSARVTSAAGLAEFARDAVFPVVAKDSEPWLRMRSPVVGGTTVLHRPSELLALAPPGAAGFSLLLQEYLPPEHAEDWIVHLYQGADPAAGVLFTGVKVRSWPPDAGQTACACAVANPELAGLAGRFCREVGFRGIADLDWRYDRRDGQYKLVDFNPRLGNQFRLFVTDAGIDVVRAQYLDLTGHGLPAGRQLSGRRFVVEHTDALARLAYRSLPRRAPSAPARAAATELAWAARDDPLPFLAVWPRLAGPLATQVARAARARRRGKARPDGPTQGGWT